MRKEHRLLKVRDIGYCNIYYIIDSVITVIYKTVLLQEQVYTAWWGRRILSLVSFDVKGV